MAADAVLDFLRASHEPVPAAPEVPTQPPAGDAP
jgi:hypothetical protein